MKAYFNGLVLKLKPKNRIQLLGLYTVLFAITVVLTYLPFIITNTSLMFSDGILQHYETRVHLQRIIQQFLSEKSFSFWSWNIGLGADTIGSLGYVLFDPFSYIAALFPEKYLSVGYSIGIYLQLYMAGVGFMYFSKVAKIRLRHSLWGAFAYAFSSWAIVSSGAHSFFLTVLVLFPFLMAGVEKVLRKQSPFVLIATIVLCAITSLYFSYMSAIVILLYLLYHFIKKEEKTLRNAVVYWGKFVLYVGTAACFSAIILIPAFYTLANAVKESSTQYSLLHPFSSYVNYFSFLIGGQEVFQQYSTICVIPLFLLTLPSVFHHIRKRKLTPAMFVFFMSLIFLLFPFFNSVFNGFSYPVGRWCYSATFFYVLSGVQCMEEDAFDLKQYKKSISVMLCLFSFMLFFIGRVLLKMNYEVTVMTGVVNVFFAYLFYVLLTGDLKKRGLQSVLVTLAVVCNIISAGCVRFLPGVSAYMNRYSMHGEMHEKLNYSTQRAGTEIDDSSFYRIDQIDHITGAKTNGSPYKNISNRQIHNTANETLVFNTRSIYSYLSTTPGHLFELYRLLGNNASYFLRICTYSNDNRTRLDFLTGVKYFLGNNPKNQPPTGANEYASYGFSPVQKSSQGVDILKNKYSIGLGCTFDNYITQSEWLSLDYPDREQALMQCVVLPDKTETSLTHIDVHNLSSGFERAAFHVTGNSGVTLDYSEAEQTQNTLGQPGSLDVTSANGKITFQLDKNYDNCELYFIARNLKRDIQSTIERRFSSGSSYSLLDRARTALATGANYDDYGGFYMYASMNGISKTALNSAGRVNGFSNIKDYMINLGQYNKNTGEITVSLNTIGKYSYDAIEILAVPLSTYESSAVICSNNAYDITAFSDNYVSGTVHSAQESAMLYLSIPYNVGWKAYVDGIETPTEQIDTAFTGISVQGKGKHTVELRYRPIGYWAGIAAFFVGAASCIAICLWRFKRKAE